MDTSNWRGQLHPDTRRLTRSNILDKLKLDHRLGDDDELLELQKIAQSVEQKSYAGATSQSDYFEKIASMMLLLEKAREREWKNQLPPDSRQRIINRVMETLRRHLPVSGPEGLQDIWRLAESIEEVAFNLATSQRDYLSKISLKMLTMEMRASQRLHGQPSNQFVIASDNEPTNSGDMNMRNQSNRSRRLETRDYQMD